MAASTKDGEKTEEYILAEDTEELTRLTDQHKLITDHLDGKLVLAPLDLKQDSLRILDSATADGLWLRDLYSSLGFPSSHTYVGTDIVESYFPKPSTLPVSISFHNQSMQKPFPSSWLNTFSLVHQRYGLAAASEIKPHGVVKNLLTLVKPSGWIQLVEADFRDCAGLGPVMTSTHKLYRELFDIMGSGSEYSRQMKGWLEEAGCVDVEEKAVDVRLGKQHPDEKLAEIGVRTTCQVTGMMVGLATSVMKTTFEPVELSTMVADLEKELTTVGGTYRLYVVWGRKPE